MKRNHTIDIVRLLGAFAVIVIHIGFTRPPWEAQIRLLARFAVPFFFMASGYFFEQKHRSEGTQAFASTLLNLLSIYLIANLVYLPLTIGTALVKHQPIALSLDCLLLGTWQHLWFVGSLIVGYLILWLLYQHRLQKILPYLSAIVLAVMWLSESYSFLGIRINMPLARTFLSIPLLYIGMLLSRYEVEKKAGLPFFIVLALLGVALHVTETLMLYYFQHVPIGKMQFFISTSVMAIGFLCLSLKIQTPNPTLLSEWGRKYSLLIYLYHPFILLASTKYYAFVPPRFVFFEWMGPLLAFALTLVPILLIEKYLPTVYKVMNGKLS